jgi:hypothetical protein
MREARETGDADRQQEISDVHSWLWGRIWSWLNDQRKLIPLAFWFGLAAAGESDAFGFRLVFRAAATSRDS